MVFILHAFDIFVIKSSTGFFKRYLSAFFNHSCISNCIKKTIGDMMTFYALRDIEKGEEITIR